MWAVIFIDVRAAFSGSSSHAGSLRKSSKAQVELEGRNAEIH
jgi:hypothetical protein